MIDGHTSSAMSQKPAREQPQDQQQQHQPLITRRSSFRKSLSDTALPDEYLVQLEEKRKQLDESIHKYIAAKERDYKVYEKELRHQHRNAQGQDTANGSSSRRLHADPNSNGRTRIHNEGDASARHPPSDSNTEYLDRSTVSGLRDRRASLERDKEFVGLFTPVYLPAIDDREKRELERTLSAPPVPILERPHTNDKTERSYSDTVVQAKPKRPSHLALTQRTSSSGSSADGKLPSALKSPSQLPNSHPKRKRVSLAVGDEIVAPSDNVPAPPTHSNTPSHSRQRARRELTPLSQSSTQSPTKESEATNADNIIATPSGEVPAKSPPSARSTQDGILAAPVASILPIRQPPSPVTEKLDPDGDLFDLEAVEEVPIQHDDDFEIVLDSDDDAEDDEIMGRVEDDEDSTILAQQFDLDSSNMRYDPTTGMIPEPEHGTDSAVPYLAFGPGSAVSSQQPINPGFRRPSVVDDPVFRSANYDLVERDAVENEIYGSSFTRPSKGSFTAGSLGESYMVKHAAEMMKMRAERRQAEVES
jgi:hypothetical protein